MYLMLLREVLMLQTLESGFPAAKSYLLSPFQGIPFPSLWLESSSLQFCEDPFSPFDPSTDTFPIRIREALTTRRLLEEGGELLLVLCATWGVGNSEDVKVCNTAIDYDIRVHRR